ncbi:carbohydrate deacetylase [Coprinopsis marcescibilis]|uniref:Carbohydrate deacetylase n=1 Tax=Coprinopsis marcescibilis TaxID=230819 RepID=A0A5C3KDV8_COPMA|nr:carbohydrate deacetylase [Coprinopsis marcescibilis]
MLAQCGGSGWTGSTSCVSGYFCSVLNDWYHQCLPGQATPTLPPPVQSSTSLPPTIPSSTTLAPLPQPSVNGTELIFGNLYTGCTVAGTIAITFDDGPFTWTSALIDSLNTAKVKATFFVVGRMYGCIYQYADVIKKAYDSGHQIASHTWSHANLSGANSGTINTEITRLETALKKILGIRPKWLRPPYGGTSASMLSNMRTLRYKVVTWNLDTEDWNNLSVQSSQAKFNALNNNRDPKIIPLAHDALQSTAQQLGPWIANWANQRGLKAVTLSECMGEPIPGGQYDIVGQPEPRDGTWTC